MVGFLFLAIFNIWGAIEGDGENVKKSGIGVNIEQKGSIEVFSFLRTHDKIPLLFTTSGLSESSYL